MIILDLIKQYVLSSNYKGLRLRTKVDYQRFMRQAHLTIHPMSTVMLGDMDVTMSGHEAKRHYEVWLDRGVPTANHITSVMRLLFNYGIEMGYCDGNPFKAFKRQTSTPRKQSKRRAEVHLPIEGDLLDMLVQQRDDFGFQDYVAPVPTSDGQCYRPYSDWYLSKMSRVVMRVAGLSDNLRLSDLRRTGTIEMVEAGVPMGQIMAVTGHANPQSVKPYMKATYTAANAALTTRRSNVGLKD